MTNSIDPKELSAPEDDVITNNDTVKEKTKERKRPPALVAMIIVCFVLIVVLLTMALLTSMDEVTNVFNGGKVDIVLKEPNWEPSNGQNVVPDTEIDKNPSIYNNEKTDVFVFLKVTVPCIQTEIEKSETDADKGKVLLNSTGSTEEKVTVPMYKFGIMTQGRDTDDTGDDKYDYYSLNTDGAENYFQQKTNAGWTLLKDESKLSTDKKTYTYIYAHTEKSDSGKLLPLLPDHTTEFPLFDRVKLVNFDEHYEANRDYSIRVEAYGIQSYYLKENNSTTYVPSEVWAMIKK